MIENSYNLVDEKWIPIEGRDKASLKDVFSPSFIGLVSGNAIQKISIYKLLFAIAQDAISLKDEKEWREFGLDNFSKACLEYLEENRDCFYLYGEKPFLQYPELAKKDQVPIQTIFYSYIPDIAAKNDTIIYQTQNIPPKDDGEKALFVLTLMSYALGGKRTSKAQLFLNNPDDSRKKPTAKTSPSLGYSGYQQSIFLCLTLLETVYNNFFTEEELNETTYNKNNVVAPWREMPTLESSAYNDRYKDSIFAWYVSMSRAVLLIDDGIKYCEELVYDSNDWFDPFITIKGGNNKKEIIAVETSKKPWRNILALLAEVNAGNNRAVRCFAINAHLERIRNNTNCFSIWVGGLKVTNTSKDLSIKQTDDYVESNVLFECKDLGENYYENFRSLLNKINDCENKLKQAIDAYYKELLDPKKNEKDNDKRKTKRETRSKKRIDDYWQKMNDMVHDLFKASSRLEKVDEMSKTIFFTARGIYDEECRKESSREIIAWIRNRL